MTKARELFLQKNAGFINGLTKAISGAGKMNKAKGITGLSAFKNQAVAGLRNTKRYIKKNPVKAGVGALAGYGGYKLVTD
jgi:hypothetical protein